MHRDQSSDCYAKVLDPDARLKHITNNVSSVHIDETIPPRRYYRSGNEMVRMANVYYEEGSLENAFILYLKFMTLFIEKIRTHPHFSTVTATEKSLNNQKLKEVLPKAESLKRKLLESYKQEYELYLRNEKIKAARIEKERREKEILKKEKEAAGTKLKPASSQVVKEPTIKHHLTPVPQITGELYPNYTLDEETNKTSTPAKPPSLFVDNTPTVNRGTKPSNLLSPTVISPYAKLRMVIIPGNLFEQFLSLSQRNTFRNVETCGILAGKLKQNELVITHLLIPEQTGSADACDTLKEEDIFDYQDCHDLITFGWIHTHPTQTAFLSSVDLHTHFSYQRMMPEAIAIVCAPRYSENKFFYLTPNYGLDFIANCKRSGFHPHPTEPELYAVASHVKIDSSFYVEVVDLRSNKQ